MGAREGVYPTNLTTALVQHSSPDRKDLRSSDIGLRDSRGRTDHPHGTEAISSSQLVVRTGAGFGPLLIPVAVTLFSACSTVVIGLPSHDAGTAPWDRSFVEDITATDELIVHDMLGPDRPDASEYDVIVRTPPAPRLTSKHYHTCFRRDPSTGWCWGSNFFGELGVDPPPGPTVDVRATPIRDSSEVGASVVAGPVSTVMIGAMGAMSLRGSHPALHSGTGPFVRSAHSEWVELTGWRDPVSPIVASGLLCALSEGRVGCVGFDSTSLVFSDSEEAILSSVTLIDGLNRVAQFDVGSTHLCAITNDGTLYCAGRNGFGQCGAPPATRHSVGPVLRLPAVTQVTVGGSATCALSVDGEVWCWGRNYDGTLGDETTRDRWEPARVPGLQRVTSVELSEAGSACAVSDGRVYCWGSPIRTYAVSGSRTGNRPTLVSGLERVDVVSLGIAHACALTREDTVYCWGDRAYGQLGNGDILWMQPTQAPSIVALPR